MNNTSIKLIIAVALFLGGISAISASESAVLQVLEKDPHRNELGFFDLHVCNWPDRPPFFKSLFSSTRFAGIEKLEIFFPDGSKLGELGLTDFMRIRKEGKPEKRVFLRDIDVPEGSQTGWYMLRVTAKDGKVYEAKDYVIITLLPQADGMQPPNGSEDIAMPKTLSWEPVPGAAYYQVFVREAFEDKRVVSSKLITEPRFDLEPGTLEAGGVYSWSIHARDVNEHILLGDFNQGSLSRKSEFSIAE